MNKDLIDTKIAIVGLGYVGLPLAVEFSKIYSVIGFDLDQSRVDQLNKGYDRTKEVTPKAIKSSSNLQVSSNLDSIKNANTYIITVPTPVDSNNIPDLLPLKSATKSVSKYISKGDIVIYESTVFPGCTEEICVPIIEEFSGLSYNKDFFCGYSPERINPGDKEHTLTNIVKITSGSNKDASTRIDLLYSSIINAGTYNVSSIAVAEAAKIIENTQRDVNIALINELSILFNELKLDTLEILEAAGTKWNFLPFRPGLVGGHCIGVDPYYLTYKANQIGYDPKIILAGREMNDGMSKYIAERAILELNRKKIDKKDFKIGILGLTFKENCPDLRNTKVLNIYNELQDYNCIVTISDSWADPMEIKSHFKIHHSEIKDIESQDAIILAVGHSDYLNFSLNEWSKLINPGGILLDIKSLYDKNFFKDSDISHWRL